MFKHFGSKWLLSRRTDPPQFAVIVEPFAGGAGYSLRYGAGRTVRLYDVSPAVCLLWNYLLGVSQEEILALSVAEVHAGADIRELGLAEAPMRLIQRWITPQGSTSNWRMPPVGSSDAQDKPGSWWSCATRQRIADQLPLLSRWTIQQLSWEQIPVEDPATWVVDPPYQTNAHAPSAYGTAPINYSALGAWCRRLPGQVMVHEQHGATWLPFETLNATQRTGRSSAAKGLTLQHEVWWRGGTTTATTAPPQLSLFDTALSAITAAGFPATTPTKAP